MQFSVHFCLLLVYNRKMYYFVAVKNLNLRPTFERIASSCIYFCDWEHFLSDMVDYLKICSPTTECPLKFYGEMTVELLRIFCLHMFI